jgi:alpha-1,2-mannosyltransferase
MEDDNSAPPPPHWRRPGTRQCLHVAVREQGVGWPAVAASAVIAAVVLWWHLCVVPLADPHYGLFANHADLDIYRAGGRAILQGTPLYSGPIWWGMEWTYTPWAALLLSPLGLISQHSANIIWWAGTIATLLAVVMMCLHRLGYRRTSATAAAAVFTTIAVTALEPVRDTIWLGQINIYLMAAILFDLTITTSRTRGLLTGIAAGIKLTPLLFLPYLVWTRQWRACIAMLCGFGGTIAVGALIRPQDSWTYWTATFFHAGRVGGTDGPANQSINGTLSQLLRYFRLNDFADGETYHAPWWLWLPLAAVTAVWGLSLAARAHRQRREMLAVTLTALTAAAISPFSWGHHWVWCVPLLLMAIDYAATSRRAATIWWCAPIGIIILTFAWWYNYWNSGPWRGSDHVIGIGLFMLPRPYPPDWWHYLAIPVIAGCYPLLLLATLTVITLNQRRQHNPPIHDNDEVEQSGGRHAHSPISGTATPGWL